MDSGNGNKPQGRARGRGRASTQNVQQGGRRPPGPGVGQSAPRVVQPAPPPAQSAWRTLPEPGHPTSSGAGVSQPGPRPAAPTPLQGQGRATLHRVVPGEGGGGDAGAASTAHAGGESTRGNMRGRRAIGGEIIHTRPTNIVTKRGKMGSEITLQANYFRVLKKPTWNLYQYAVDFAPSLELNRVRKGLLSNHKELLGGYIFDGNILFIAHKLHDDPTVVVSNNRDGEPYNITMKFVSLISMNDSRSLQVLNLILRRAMEGLELQLVGRNFFDAVAKIDIPEYHVQLWPGYITSIRQHEQDILLCTELSHKVMRTETIYDILKRCSQENRNFQESFKREVIGMVVLTDYNNKTYRVDDVDFNSTPKQTFDTKTGKISFVDYYYKKYNKRIHDVNQPVLLSRARERDIRAGQTDLIILIPELCRATGLTDTMRGNFRLMKALGDHTRMAPDRRMNGLTTFNQRLSNTQKSRAVLNEWTLTLDKHLIEIPGRHLASEEIWYGNKKIGKADQKADWTRDMTRNAMYSVVNLNKWFVICPNRCQREARDFVKTIQEVSRGLNMNFAAPEWFQIPDDRNHSYVNAIENCCAKDPQLVMCVVPNNNAERYSSIKKKTCVDRPIPSQVMCLRTITPKGGNPRSLMSIATKVAIQINCKLGGAPWMIKMPLGGLMTIGFDVCHSTRDKSKSYGAMVATMDLKERVQFFSAVSAHQNGEELSNELSLQVVKALKQYRTLHGALPSRILFYRDGVGEGQVHHVFEHEVNIIRTKLEEIYKSAGVEGGLKFAFIIVNKRINTRFFARNQNPPPGTVVDDVVTLPERYDFYLVSQSVNQGTVSPTSYNVIYDTMGFDPDKLQIITYKMTHLYYNWSGTTRVPAVCQYAHKLAFLVGQYIHQNPAFLLEKQLYFL